MDFNISYAKNFIKRTLEEITGGYSEIETFGLDSVENVRSVAGNIISWDIAGSGTVENGKYTGCDNMVIFFRFKNCEAQYIFYNDEAGVNANFNPNVDPNVVSNVNSRDILTFVRNFGDVVAGISEQKFIDNLYKAVSFLKDKGFYVARDCDDGQIYIGKDYFLYAIYADVVFDLIKSGKLDEFNMNVGIANENSDVIRDVFVNIFEKGSDL